MEWAWLVLCCPVIVLWGTYQSIAAWGVVMKSIFFISLAILVLNGCSSSLSTSSHYSDGDECSTGSLGCPCYGNGTCDNDLSCVDDTCVDPTNLDGDLDYDHESYADAENVLDSDTDNLLCVSGECCQDGLPVPTGEPCLTGQDSLDCTDDVCNANHACVHNLQEGKCLIQNICYDSNEDNPSNFCQYCDPLDNPNEWQNKQDSLSCDDGDHCSTASVCQNGFCTATEWVENDCSVYMECGLSPSGCYNCGTCDAETQICWECDSTIQSCWPGEGIDTQVCAPDKGGSCGDMSGLQEGSPWPMWTGSPTNQSRSLFVGPQTPVLKWVLSSDQCDNCYRSTVIGNDGTLYSNLNDLYALNPNGTVKWVYSFDSISATCPAIAANGDILAAQPGEIVSVSRFGKLNWSFSAGGDHAAGISIGEDGTVYACGGGGSSNIYAIYPDGSERWTYNTGGHTWGVPVLSPDGTIYTTTQSHNRIIALNLDGERIWQRDNDGYSHLVSLGYDGTIYSPQAGGILRALEPGNGDTKWITRLEESPGGLGAIGNDGTIYSATRNGGGMYAIHPDGQIKWKNEELKDAYSSISVDSDGNSYVGTQEGKIYVFDVAGNTKWSYQTEAPIRSIPSIDMEGTLYFSNDRALYAFQDGCTPNESWCGADNLYTCNETGDGLAGDPVDCPGGCNWGSCMDKGSMLSEIRYHGASIPVSDSIGFDSLNLTIEFWLKTGYPKTILYKGEYFRDSTNYTVRLLDCADDDSCNLFFGMRYEGVDYSWRAPVEKDQTVWRHFAVVADNESQSLKMFMNGSELTLTEFPENWPAGMLRTNEALKINMLEGIYYIDELRISDVPRYSENFIPPLRHVPDGNTQLLLHFDEGTGDVVHDSSPYENHGELTGSASWSEDVPGGTR